MPIGNQLAIFGLLILYCTVVSVVLKIILTRSYDRKPRKFRSQRNFSLTKKLVRKAVEGTLAKKALHYRVNDYNNHLTSSYRYGDINDILTNISLSAPDPLFFRGFNTDIFLLNRKFNFEEDLMITVHVQKTAGTTLGTYIHEYMNRCAKTKLPQAPQQKRIKYDFNCCRYFNRQNPLSLDQGKQCSREQKSTWLVSRLSPVEWPCGLHAGVTEMDECISYLSPWYTTANEKRSPDKYWVTMVRNGSERYISEWLHVKRGARWDYERHSRRMCNGIDQSDLYPRCFEDYSLAQSENVTIDVFLDCRYNFANNRQVRQLARLQDVHGSNFIGCYHDIFKSHDSTDDEYMDTLDMMLESARYNLENRFTFFGLSDELRLSQYVFEQTFGVEFSKMMTQNKGNLAHAAGVSQQSLSKIDIFNEADNILYDYARSLFFSRLRLLRLREIGMLSKD